MSDDSLEEFRSASVAAEQLINCECGDRVGRNAAILVDCIEDICDSRELRLASLANAYAIHYFSSGFLNRSVEGCLRSFADYVSETLEGLFGFGGPNHVINTYEKSTDAFFDGYEDIEYDPKSILPVPSDDDPLDDREAVEKDPSAAVLAHLANLSDGELDRLFDAVTRINRDRGYILLELPPADPRSVAAFLRVVDRLNHEWYGSPDDCEDDDYEELDDEEAEAEEAPLSERQSAKRYITAAPGQTPAMIEGCERDGYGVKEAASEEGRIPRFEASDGKVRVEFVFGGVPDEDTQKDPRA